ncbi:hypothetical protein MAR_011085 [Mya arenaria]|uniref:TLDc domain-containing protein n=1 Tax=Mya arenaria TaxID=6604 RepID=A0ABY7FX14_MYAAR|nr:hypothetical protein MAR_011085 [Mya arenaria]
MLLIKAKEASMAGRLTDEEMNQLETWIGSGSKAFSLLYSITRDACDPAAFHRLCDNQGPTVTVLYNTQGSVFGGYTSASWDVAKGGYIPDDKAFLFQLRYSANRKCTKFPVKQPELAVYSSKTHGPCFGKGASDLATFFDKPINHNDGVFALNGNMINFGMTFERMGVHTQEINNGHMNITDLKVYSVTGETGINVSYR